MNLPCCVDIFEKALECVCHQNRQIKKTLSTNNGNSESMRQNMVAHARCKTFRTPQGGIEPSSSSGKTVPCLPSHPYLCRGAAQRKPSAISPSSRDRTYALPCRRTDPRKVQIRFHSWPSTSRSPRATSHPGHNHRYRLHTRHDSLRRSEFRLAWKTHPKFDKARSRHEQEGGRRAGCSPVRPPR